jgi:hypothetical protein
MQQPVQQETASTQVWAPGRASLFPDASGPEAGAAVFVWGIWASLLLILLLWVGRFVPNMPLLDEWYLLPVLMGDAPPTPGWAWSQYGEHRAPLARLLDWGLTRMTGPDFRAGIWASVLILGALTLILVRTARQVRGWTSYADAFFPLAVLPYSQSEIFMQSFVALAFSTSTLLAGAVLCLSVGCPTQVLSFRQARLVGLCLLVLPLTGTQGMVLVPALALWLGCRWAGSYLPLGFFRTESLVLFGLLTAVCLLVPLYYFSLDLTFVAPPSTLRRFGRGALQFLSMSLSSAAADLWPLIGYAILFLGLLATLLLIQTWYQQPGQRWRLFGIVCFLAAMGSLALAVAWGRADFYDGKGCFEQRYAVLAAPLLCGLYLIGCLHPGTGGRLLQMSLFTLVCALFLFHFQRGLQCWSGVHAETEAFESDLRAGVPTPILAEHYTADFLNPSWDEAELPASEEIVMTGLRRLRQAGIGVCRALQEVPPFQEIDCPVASIIPYTIQRHNSLISWENDGPRLVFPLPRPRQVYALRLKYSQASRHKGPRPITLQVYWKPIHGQKVQAEQTTDIMLSSGSGARTVTVWINALIARLGVRPLTKPGSIHIEECVLWVPKDAP